MILEAALRVFSVSGFEGASNKDIAREAGIASPGLIYHYFVDKHDLLRHVIEEYSPPVELAKMIEQWIGNPPSEVLPLFAHRYLSITQNPQLCAAMRLFIGEALRNSDLAETLAKVGPLRICGAIARYLEDQMERGTIKRSDPMTLSIIFFSPLFVYVFAGKILMAPAITQIDDKALVESLVGGFLSAHVIGAGNES
jgi:AcrR family transcriptional regulator